MLNHLPRERQKRRRRRRKGRMLRSLLSLVSWPFLLPNCSWCRMGIVQVPQHPHRRRPSQDFRVYQPWLMRLRRKVRQHLVSDPRLHLVLVRREKPKKRLRRVHHRKGDEISYIDSNITVYKLIQQDTYKTLTLLMCKSLVTVFRSLSKPLPVSKAFIKEACPSSIL